MKNSAQKMTYAAAYEELQQIVAALQQEQTGIDELPEKIARANELIAFCREHLRKTETLLSEMGNEG